MPVERDQPRGASEEAAVDRAGSDQPSVSRAGPNTAQLRAAIPSARTVTEVSAREPAAAPFDTDDEAAGRPAQAAAVEQAMAHEGRLPAQTSGSGARAGLPGSVWIIAALLVAVLLLWMIVF